MSSVNFNKVVKRYGENEIIHGIDLSIADREFLVLVGPSGCGKSTLLRMVAGLEEISGGQIKIGDRVVNDLPPKDREIAMVFQDYALYPHMNVYENMSFGLKLRKLPKDEIDRRVREAAEILQITHLLERKPKDMSGGQRQRVAIGRAIVRHPEVFLFDEPLSNLDAKLREEMRIELAKLHQKLNATMIYVTHDQIEAMTLGTRIAVLKDGYLQQLGTPDEVYNQPANLFVAGFMGSPRMNMIEGKFVQEGEELFFTNAQVKLTLGKGPEAKALAQSQAKRVILGLRPEDIHVEFLSDRVQVVEAKLDVSEHLGSKKNLYFVLGEAKLLASVSSVYQPHVGEVLKLGLLIEKAHWFDAESGKRL